MKVTNHLKDTMKTQLTDRPLNRLALGSAIFAPLLAVAFLLVPAVSHGATVIDGSIFNVNFESPYYTVGNSYVASTNVNTGMTGTQPNHITSITNLSTGTNWTASIQSLSGSNQMNFAVDAGAQLQGRFEASNGGAVSGSTSGTWGASADFTLNVASAQGRGLISNFQLVNASGNSLGSNLVEIKDTEIVGSSSSVTLTLGQAYALRYELDMGTNAAGNARFYVDNVLISSLQKDLTSQNVGALQVNLSNNNVAVARGFSLDNILVGQVVPEPTTLALLGIFGGAMLLRRRLAIRRR